MNSNQILTFLSEHWLLSAAFLIAVVALVINEVLNRATSDVKLSPEQLVYSMNRDNAVVLDVRTEKLFALRNIVGSINIPDADIQKKLKALQQYQGKLVVVVDANGQTVTKITKLLGENNFSNVKQLVGGIAAWQQTGLPLVSTKKDKPSKAAKKPKPSKAANTNAVPKVVIYSKQTCPYCDRAKDLFDAINVSYTEIRVDLDQDKLQEMLDKSKRRTVPQIFIGDTHVGGFDDLHALQQQNKLDLLLKGKKI